MLKQKHQRKNITKERIKQLQNEKIMSKGSCWWYCLRKNKIIFWSSASILKGTLERGIKLREGRPFTSSIRNCSRSPFLPVQNTLYKLCFVANLNVRLKFWDKSQSFKVKTRNSEIIKLKNDHLKSKLWDRVKILTFYGQKKNLDMANFSFSYFFKRGKGPGYIIYNNMIEIYTALCQW